MFTTSVANLARPQPRPHPGLQDQPCRWTAAVEHPEPEADAPSHKGGRNRRL